VLVRNLAYQPSAPEPDQFPPESSEQAPAACPYKGLAAFEPADARWFFGREQLTTMLVSRLAERYDEAGLLAELPDPGRAAEILDVFSAGDTRLVTIGEDTIEITHDALLRAWPRLSEWIEANRAGLLIHQHLAEAARAWQQDEHDPAALYRGTRLALAQDWADSDGHRQALGPVAQEFLAASIRRDAEERRAARRRTRRRYQLIAILTVLLVLSLFGAVQWRTASQQRSP
jgi:hypothetical protein